MGNETSQLSGLEIDEKAVEVTDFWTHHSAVVNNSESVSELTVFIGEPLVGGTLWVNQTPLEKASKNLMLHRHPCILKYISSWNKGSKFYLAVENVQPLSHHLAKQSTLQLCIGLHSILKALVFLNNKALASHNNVCTASIYVTADGSWKLGGLEYLCKLEDLNASYLLKTRNHRYEKAIDSNEEQHAQNGLLNMGAIDQYAFGVLAGEVLRKKSDSDLPSLQSFRDFCKNELQNVDIQKRPNLSSVLEHSFFTHDFILIHSFLNELPLKTESEKCEFFATLLEKLKKFSENVVAGQLGSLLLSRMVLLDETAQKEVLPFILRPKEETKENEASPYLFSVNTYKICLIPKLLQIFRVRDAQIRLLLLTYFKYFIHCFSSEELQNHILPELLLGIKDTNDHLVATTLRSLADLVPVLGAATVIGGKRAKLFTDGRPMAHINRKVSKRSSRRSSSVPTLPVVRELPAQENEETPSSSFINQDSEHIIDLPERPSPDGGEDNVSTTEEVEQSIDDDLDNWSDWDIQEGIVDESDSGRQQIDVTENFNTLLVDTDISITGHSDVNLSDLNNYNSEIDSVSSVDNLNTIELDLTNINRPSLHSSVMQNKTNSLPDILELDIKNQKNIKQNKNSDEFDFFQDMEPVIESTNKFLITENDENQRSDDFEFKTVSFNLSISEDVAKHEESGWGDELDWEEEND